MAAAKCKCDGGEVEAKKRACGGSAKHREKVAAQAADATKDVPDSGRSSRAHGGRTKGKTNITIIIGQPKDKEERPDVPPPPSALPPPPPPPRPPTGMPPGAMGGPGMGGPPPMPPGPPPGMPPMGPK
jgi:hypothetical protein